MLTGTICGGFFSKEWRRFIESFLKKPFASLNFFVSFLLELGGRKMHLIATIYKVKKGTWQTDIHMYCELMRVAFLLPNTLYKNAVAAPEASVFQWWCHLSQIRLHDQIFTHHHDLQYQTKYDAFTWLFHLISKKILEPPIGVNMKIPNVEPRMNKGLFFQQNKTSNHERRWWQVSNIPALT